MKTDEKGILTKEEQLKVLSSLPTTFKFGQSFAPFCQAQHEADVEAVEAVPNPYEGIARAKSFELARHLFLFALKAKGG